MRSRAFVALPAVTCAAVLVLSGCGGSGGGASSASSNGSTSSSTKATAKGSSGFCNSLQASLKDTQSLSTSTQPSDLKALVEKGRQEAGSIVAAAPDAIKKDVTILVDASTSYYDALAAANYNVSKVDVTKLKSFTSSEVQQASQRVSSYIQSNCGITVGATP